MTGGKDTVESTVEGFLELESELDGEAAPGGAYEQGTIAGATKVPATEVPHDYPWRVDTREALQLEVDVGEGTVTTYLSWPEEGAGRTHTERLLDALGYSRDQFADCYGETVALANADGWHRVDIQRTNAMRVGAELEHQGFELSEAAVALGVLTSAIAFATTPVLPKSILNPLYAVGWLGLAGALYWDLTSVKRRITWETDTKEWVAGALVPFVNVPVGAAYLLDRRVRLSGTGPGVVSDRWYAALKWSLGLILVGFALAFVDMTVGAIVLFYPSMFLPFAIYFDAEYVEDATDWDPNEDAWAGAALLTAVGLLSVLVAVVYVLVRNRKVD